VTPHLHAVDGIYTASLAFSARLRETGRSVDVLTPGRVDDAGPWEQLGCRVIRSGALEPNFHQSARIAFEVATWLARATPYDVVDFHRWDLYGMAMRAGGRRRSTLAAHVHNAPPVQRITVSPIVAPILFAKHVITASAFMKHEWHAAGVPAQRLQVLPYGLQLPPADGNAVRRRVRSEQRIAADTPVVAFVGRTERIKGVHVLLDAIKSDERLRRRCRLIVHGQSNDRSTEGNAYADDVAKGVAALGGWLRDASEPVAETYAAADLVVVPSLWAEPSGLVVAEAMTWGRPVISSAVGGIPEQYPRSLRNDLLVPPDDPGALRAAIERLLFPASNAPLRIGSILQDHIADRIGGRLADPVVNLIDGGV
jgi:glycosyltransferase involved in cell wall biosynthesis